jgi:hypothetical protein
MNAKFGLFWRTFITLQPNEGLFPAVFCLVWLVYNEGVWASETASPSESSLR